MASIENNENIRNDLKIISQENEILLYKEEKIIHNKNIPKNFYTDKVLKKNLFVSSTKKYNSLDNKDIENINMEIYKNFNSTGKNYLIFSDYDEQVILLNLYWVFFQNEEKSIKKNKVKLGEKIQKDEKLMHFINDQFLNFYNPYLKNLIIE